MIEQSLTQSLLNSSKQRPQKTVILLVIIILLTCTTAACLSRTISLQKELQSLRSTTLTVQPTMATLLNLSLTGVQYVKFKAEAGATNPITDIDLSNCPLTYFQNNTLPQLETLTIVNNQKNVYFISNVLYNLRNLIFQAQSTDLFAYNYLPALTQLNLTTEILDFRDNDIENITKLRINNLTRRFEGNYMPSLKEFTAQLSNLQLKLQSQCPALQKLILTGTVNKFNETLPSLKYLNLRRANIFFFKTSSPLVTLDLSYNLLSSFANCTFPDLETLDLSNNAITIFTGNYLPKIQTLNLSNNPTIDFYELLYYKELKYVTISSVPLHVKLSNLHLNWIELTAYESEIEEFYNNSFPNLRVLSFRKNPLTSFKGDSYLPELNTLNLENCQLNTFIQNNSMPQLTTLILSFNNLSRFDNYTLLKIKTLRISSNGLNSFSGNVMPSLELVDLSFNNLDDSIADVLINMNLSNIRAIYLQYNKNIVYRQAVEQSLYGKYPNITIYV